MDWLEILRYTIVVGLGLLVPPMLILGWRRRNPGIFALVIFSITGALGAFEELGEPYPGLQLPSRLVGLALIIWWLMREWCADDYPTSRKSKNTPS